MTDAQAAPGVIPFEPHRFASAAAHYVAGRPAYSPLLIARVAALCGLRPEHAVLDLGCGPGPLAHAFAPYAARVLGLDPEPEMLRLAERDAPPNVRFQQGSSYEIGPELGRFQLVTMGRSFHWMDRVDALRRLDRMVNADGAIALFSDRLPEVAENAWHAEFRALLERYTPPDAPRIGDRLRGAGHLSVLLASPFRAVEEIAVIERRETPVPALIDRALSRSTTSPERLGATKTAALAAEITASMARHAPSGVFTEIVSSNAVIARRP